MIKRLLSGDAPLFADRGEAGRALAAALEPLRGRDLVVVGLARGGVEVAAEVARALAAPLDVVAVRKIGHPFQREYAIGAVTPGDGVYVRGADDVSAEQLARIVEETKTEAVLLDRRLHADHASLELTGRTAVVVDDGLATGATMIAALRRAKACGARSTVAALPVAAAQSLASVRREADQVVCLHAPAALGSVGTWYGSFDQVDDETVIRLIADNRRAAGAP